VEDNTKKISKEFGLDFVFIWTSKPQIRKTKKLPTKISLKKAFN